VKNIPSGSRVRVEAGGESLISSAGGSLLLQTAAVSGLAAGLSRGLASWRPARSVHDPGKTVLDLAVTIALGGDCLADVAVLRAQPELFGAVASDPTISRLIEGLGDDSATVIYRDPCCSGRRAGQGLGPSPADSEHRSGRGRSGCHAGRVAFGEGGRDRELQAGLRVSPHARLC